MLHVCGISDLGCKRDENQDAILVDSIIEKKEIRLALPIEGHYYSHYGLFCAVADGLGGQKGGAVASLIALEFLAGKKYELSKLSHSSQVEDYLRDNIQSIHKQVIGQGQLNHELEGMGTTLTGVYLHSNYKVFFHVGDSRLYRFRGNFIMQLTMDHSLESLTQQEGGEYDQASKSGIITSSIGGGKLGSCKVDTGEINFIKGDILLLCSDGLSDLIALESMEEILAGRDDLATAAHCMVYAAKEAGGSDNISLVLIENK